MQIKVNDLPELLTELINKSGKLRQQIQKETKLSNSTLARICNRTHGMQKNTAKILNDYFEVPYFISYQIKNGVCVHSNIIKPNKNANKFNPGDNVMNLFNKNIFMVTDVKFNKVTQEWLYKYNNEWVEEFYLKKVTLESKPNGNNIKSVDTPSIKDMENMNNLDEILDEVLLEKEEEVKPKYTIPQFEITPEEAITGSIEKINDKDSIKSILKDVMVRLIELL